MTVTVRTRGGERTEAFIRHALAAHGVRRIEVGFYSADKEPEGTPLSNVAAWAEFGTGLQPPRPFMRRALRGLAASGELTRTVVAHVSAETMVVDGALASALGMKARDAIRASIISFSSPPNSPATRKQGGTSPLVRTGTLARGVRYKIFRT